MCFNPIGNCWLFSRAVVGLSGTRVSSAGDSDRLRLPLAAEGSSPHGLVSARIKLRQCDCSATTSHGAQHIAGGFLISGSKPHKTRNLVEQFSVRRGKIRRRCQLVPEGLPGDCDQARALIRALHEIAGSIGLETEAMKPKTTLGRCRTAAIGTTKGQMSVRLSKAIPSNSIRN